MDYGDSLVDYGEDYGDEDYGDSLLYYMDYGDSLLYYMDYGDSLLYYIVQMD